MMRLVYLPVNVAYAFAFGEELMRMGDGVPMFHSNRRDAVEAALECGLHVTRSGDVLTLDCHHEFGHHSADLVSLYHGELKPARVCGRHHRYGVTSVTYDAARYRHANEG